MSCKLGNCYYLTSVIEQLYNVCTICGFISDFEMAILTNKRPNLYGKTLNVSSELALVKRFVLFVG